MKKRIVLLLSSLAIVSMLSGCGPKDGGNAGESAPPVQEEVSAPDAQDKGLTMEISTITGTIHEMKDMSFVIRTDEGTEYLLSFQEKPEGLDSVKDSDKVEVTYGGGSLSEVDPFTGIVISVKKAE